MDGLMLRNRGNAFEVIPFDQILSIHPLQSERRGSTLERIKGATAGSLVGGSAAAVATMMAVGSITGPVGALLGGAAGVFLAVRKKFRTCKLELRDGRKIIAVAETASWAAVAASMPQAKRFSGWRKRREVVMKTISSPPLKLPPAKG
jgi:hypothetical protein